MTNPLKSRDPAFKRRALLVLRAIEGSGDTSQRDIAKQIDASLGSTNLALKALIDQGAVIADEALTSKGKRGYLYRLSSRGIDEKNQLMHDYLAFLKSEVRAMTEEIERLESELAKSKD